MAQVSSFRSSSRDDPPAAILPATDWQDDASATGSEGGASPAREPIYAASHPASTNQTRSPRASRSFPRPPDLCKQT